MDTAAPQIPLELPQWKTTHPLTPEDAAAMAALRKVAVPNKGRMQGIAGRSTFATIMNTVSAPEGVSYRPDTVGGVPGWWCMPAGASPGQALLHCHGGWFTWGSAEVFRHLVGHIAARAKSPAFIPNYRLAPEHPFPAAIADIGAAYDGLLEHGVDRILILGDSAGGNLALLLIAILAARPGGNRARPAGALVLSPVTDLALTGMSWESRATADPYFTKPQAAGLVGGYLAGHDPADPAVSPLYGTLSGLPPVRVHVGDDEMLLDDSTRYVERAAAAGLDAKLDIWIGMPHGFLSGIGRLAAADGALDAIGAFINERLAGGDVRP